MNCGQSPILCKIVINFLTSRSMSIKMNGVLSQRKMIPAGVPQGSCFSDILFLAYINDMPKHPGIFKSQFADDSLFYRTHNNCKLAAKTLNSYLRRITEFFTCWKLSICERKSEIINIVGKCSDANRKLRADAKKMVVKINDKTIPTVNSLRYLGQWFSKNASTKNHIDKAINKANITTSKLRHLLRSTKITCNV